MPASPATVPLGVCLCANGRAHLQFGATTVNLSLEQFRTFARLAAQALASVDEGRDLQAALQVGRQPH